MVNTGRPSRGCALCRKRKIKCDEAKPACRNCSKYGRECPGWPGFPSLIRARSDENQKFANNTPKRHILVAARTDSCQAYERIRYSSTPEIEQTKLQAQRILQDQLQESRYLVSTKNSPIIKSSTVVRADTPLSILPESLDHLEDQAVENLFSCGIMSTLASNLSNVNPAGAIYEMCRESGPSSPLHQALKAAGLANLANRTSTTEMRMRARNEYGQAIGALKYILGDPKKCLEDYTLATLLILRMCEILFTFNKKPYTQSGPHETLDDWQSHVEGMHALLHLRGHDRLRTPRERWLFQVAWRAVRAQLRRNCQEPDETLCRLNSELDQKEAGHLYPLVSCDTYYERSVGKLRFEIKTLIERTRAKPQLPGYKEGLSAMLRTAEDLDAGVDHWLSRNEQWQPLLVSPEVAMDLFHGRTFAQSYFTDPRIFAHVRRISFVRIKLHESLIAAFSAKLELMEHGHIRSPSGRVQAPSSSFAAIDKLITRHVEVVRQEVTKLLGWVSYGLGDVGEDGMLVGTDGGRPDTLRFDDGYKQGLKTIEVYVHLAPMVKTELLTEGQLEAAGLVLCRIVDWFRRMPI